MNVASAAQLRRELTDSRESLLQAISGVSEQQFKRRPESTPEDNQPWCIAEVLTHLLLDEQVWTARIAIALASDGAEVLPTDREEQSANVRAGRLAPVPQIIHGLLAARRDLDKLLAQVEQRDGGLGLSVHQPERGVLTIDWMVRKVIGHETEHVSHIEAIKESMAAEAARAI